MKDIQNTNGWVEINSADDLPKTVGEYENNALTEWILATDGQEIYSGYFEIDKTTDTWLFKGKSIGSYRHIPDECLPITHWRLTPELP